MYSNKQLWDSNLPDNRNDSEIFHSVINVITDEDSLKNFCNYTCLRVHAGPHPRCLMGVILGHESPTVTFISQISMVVNLIVFPNASQPNCLDKNTYWLRI